MKRVRIISTILFYVSRCLAIFYFTISTYSLISILTTWSYIVKDGGKYFAVCYPFTQTAFLNGDNNWSYKLFNFLIPIGLIGLFFLLVSNVFKVFMQSKLFTANGVTQLKWFYLANFILPSLSIFLATFFAGKIEEGLEMLAVIHFILGVFAYFLAAIFKQGLQLQNEQDLFI